MEVPSDLVERDCWELLALASVGRLALSVNALPAILPVQYYLDGPTVTICLGEHELPVTSVDGTVVAFAADSLDSSPRSGWTVQVQGVLRVPMPDGVPRDCGQPAAGRLVHLESATVSGHRFNLCPFIDGF